MFTAHDQVTIRIGDSIEWNEDTGELTVYRLYGVGEHTPLRWGKTRGPTRYAVTFLRTEQGFEELITTLSKLCGWVMREVVTGRLTLHRVQIMAQNPPLISGSEQVSWSATGREVIFWPKGMNGRFRFVMPHIETAEDFEGFVSLLTLLFDWNAEHDGSAAEHACVFQLSHPPSTPENL